jgi:hypothetical protein
MITRYLFQSGHASPSKAEIKRQGVKALYVEENLRYELSVFSTDGMSEPEIVDLGQNHVGKGRTDTLKYTFTFPEEIITSIDLKLDNDKLGHDKHCNVLAWPKTEEDKLEKEKELAAAINSSPQKQFWKSNS